MNMSRYMNLSKVPVLGKTEPYDWSFKVDSSGDYELFLTIHTRGRFKKLFNSTKKNLEKKYSDVDVNSINFAEVNNIGIENKYFKLLSVLIAPFYKDRKAYLLRRDKKPVILLDYHIVRAYFVRCANDWDLIVVLGGFFEDAR